jgi:hypothetical protein
MKKFRLQKIMQTGGLLLVAAAFSVVFGVALAQSSGNLSFIEDPHLVKIPGKDDPCFANYQVQNSFTQPMTVGIHLYRDNNFNVRDAISMAPGVVQGRVEFSGTCPVKSFEVVLDPDHMITETDEVDNNKWVSLETPTPTATFTPTATSTPLPTSTNTMMPPSVTTAPPTTLPPTATSTPYPTCNTPQGLNWSIINNSTQIKFDFGCPIRSLNFYRDGKFVSNYQKIGALILGLNDFKTIELVFDPDGVDQKFFKTKEELLVVHQMYLPFLNK